MGQLNDDINELKQQLAEILQSLVCQWIYIITLTIHIKRLY